MEVGRCYWRITVFSLDVSVADPFSGIVRTAVHVSLEAFLGPNYHTQCDVT